MLPPSAQCPSPGSACLFLGMCLCICDCPVRSVLTCSGYCSSYVFLVSFFSPRSLGAVADWCQYLTGARASHRGLESGKMQFIPDFSGAGCEVCSFCLVSSNIGWALIVCQALWLHYLIAPEWGYLHYSMRKRRLAEVVFSRSQNSHPKTVLFTSLHVPTLHSSTKRSDGEDKIWKTGIRHLLNKGLVMQNWNVLAKMLPAKMLTLSSLVLIFYQIWIKGHLKTLSAFSPCL